MSEPGLVALIVGGSGDIGQAVATRLGRLAYRVAITGRSQASVDAAVQRLQAVGLAARGLVLDLTDESSIAKVFDELGAAYERLDVLVNAAGVSEPRSVLKADQRHYEDVLKVNLIGPALVARHAVGRMRGAGGGAIINISSLGGTDGQKGFGAYCASKGGLNALTDSLRHEVARFGIRVATISPGKVDSRMHGSDPTRPTMIRPSDVAEAVVFLLSLSPSAVVREVRIHNAEA